MLRKDSLIPVFDWERDAADSIGQTVSVLRFMLCFFASVPVSIVFKQVPTAKGRHLYAALTGFALIYYPFGNGCLHSLGPILLTYLAMIVARPYCGMLAWLIDFSYLVYCHVASSSGTAWKEGHMDFTGAQMVLTLKVISAAVCYADGMRPEKDLNEYQRAHKLERLPSLFEFVSFTFSAGNLLSGPCFEIRDYLDYIARKGPWDPKNKVPSSTIPGIIRFIKAICCLGGHMYLLNFFPVSALEGEGFARSTFARKMLLVIVVPFVARLKYYFAWAVSEAGLIFQGFNFNGYDKAGKARWDRYSNTRIMQVELCTSLAQLPVHWNTCTGNFLRRYVYERLSKGDAAVYVTQVISGVWHGLFPGYGLFFLSSAIFIQASKLIFKYERDWSGAARNNWMWIAIKWTFTTVILNYCATAFLILDLWPTLALWRSVYFIGHVLMVGVVILGMVSPPRRPQDDMTVDLDLSDEEAQLLPTGGFTVTLGESVPCSPGVEFVKESPLPVKAAPRPLTEFAFARKGRLPLKPVDNSSQDSAPPLAARPEPSTKIPGRRRLVKRSQLDQEISLPETSRPSKRQHVCLDDDEDDDNHHHHHRSPEVTRHTAEVAEEALSGSAAACQEDEPIFVGEEIQPSEVDHVMRQCAEFSSNVQQKLAAITGYSCNDPGGGALVSIEMLQRTCGAAASFLKPYQLYGINWLAASQLAGITGGIVADEMGLGKTCQTICFLGALRELRKDHGPHLVVAPASLLENWAREIGRWCPAMKFVTYYGKDREQLRYELQSYRQQEGVVNSESDSEFEGSPSKPSHAESSPMGPEPTHSLPFDIMLTGYSLFERTGPAQTLDRVFLKSFLWSHMILDEGHAVKNAASGRSLRLRRLAEKSRRRIMLTGTPLQNDLHELRNLLLLLVPDIFGDAHAEQVPEDNEVAVPMMRNCLEPFILRRLKEDVAKQLVPKQHELSLLALTGSQCQLYNEAVAAFRKDLLKSDAAKKAAKPVQTLLKKVGKSRISNVFTHLRKIVQHPLLIRRIFTDDRLSKLALLAKNRGIFGEGCSYARILEELKDYSDHSLHNLACEHGPRFADFKLDLSGLLFKDSVKMQHLQKLLPQLRREGHRPLIFSQWTMVLDLLEVLLEHLGLAFLRLDGTTAVAERLQVCDMYNNPANGFFAMLLSTRAGGQGLNLTGADTVIMHDLDFNPQIDRQAEDRCHRLGQTRAVTVHKLVVKDTVDSGIYKSAQRKLQLDAAVLRNDTGPGDSEAPVNENAAMQQLLEGLLEPSAGGCASETPEPMSGPDAGAAAVDLLSIEPSEAEAADCGPSSGGDAARIATDLNPDHHDILLLKAGSCDGSWKSVEGMRGTGHNEARDNLCFNPCHHRSQRQIVVPSVEWVEVGQPYRRGQRANAF
ncbi:hypothetical protein WJX84_000212 [Apatococcus fuscideae]|uniref:Uncharacterized protein n=1 Tax=Apatococcus fuscideae TaxID=2026836 RepID=A0AAW1T6I2_9CHLO